MNTPPCPYYLCGLQFDLPSGQKNVTIGAWRGDREAEGSGLLNRRTDVNPYRGFESPPLRHCLLSWHDMRFLKHRDVSGNADWL